MLVLFVQTYAQFINGDKNWDTTPYYIDNFSINGRSWNSGFIDIPLSNWRAYSRDSGVSHGSSEHQVYQKQNCVFDDINQNINLVAQFVSPTPMICSDFDIPPDYPCPSSDFTLYYISGEIDALDYFHPGVQNFLYGYFEIKCKLPVHLGAFPAFWLYGGRDHYEEIDIFEYSWHITRPDLHSESPGYGSPNIFTTGLYFNDVAPTQIEYARNFPIIPSTEPNLSEWNTFACEWSPGRVIWYFNGKEINQFFGDKVPYRPMTLKANYALDNYILDNDEVPITTDLLDEMVIDYIKVNKLKCNCSDDAIIENNTQLNSFTYEAKNSVTICSSSNNISLPNSTKNVFRAVDHIEITKNFEVPLGAEMELITHDCPN
jgi:hypothetical protein